MERSPVKMLQSTDHKQTNRLYPTLPSLKRLEFSLPVGSTAEKLPPVAESPPQNVPEDKQSEFSSFEMMRAEILVLEEQNKELLAINKKWSKEYRTMVEYYIEKVRLLKGVKHDSGEEKSDEEERDVTIFKKDIRTDRQRADDKISCEVEELRERNVTLTRRGRHQQEEIRRLNEALQEALLTSEQLSKTPQDIWKYQAEVYKEDFKKERRDREKLQGKYSELEKRYRKIHSELSGFKSQMRTTQPADCCSCTKRGKNPNWEFH